MNIQVRDGLPYVTVTLLYGGRQLELANVLLDTGSTGTLFAADQVVAVGLQYEADDPVQRIRGIGGAEFVTTRRARRALRPAHAPRCAITRARWSRGARRPR
jgi:hypothetical protein